MLCVITDIHFLLTYMCNAQCDHCFVYSGPEAGGTFTLSQVQEVLEEAKKLGTVKKICFEGGEPFLFYPLMIRGVEIARHMGFDVSVVTNAYFANSTRDAELWLEPLARLGIASLSISEDLFHQDEGKETKPQWALAAAERLNIPVGTICIEKPAVEDETDYQQEKGKPVIGGSTLLKGRAVENLLEGLPVRPGKEFSECPHEDLKKPSRVHIDSYGHLHLCQGVSMGNIWDIPLSALVKNYDPESHPICGPLLKGGPYRLASQYLDQKEGQYVDACHFCYVTRQKLLCKFPEYLAPPQVYGLKDEEA